MTWSERIIVDPNILTGKPVVRGTRLAVEFIVDLLAQGWEEAEILRNYPGLTHEDISACLQYASSMLKAEKVYPLELSGALHASPGR
ncbi:MAG: antitoxin [Anaerolinea sp.]|nr:antitoxin [Anaerolinea sp.]